MLLVCMEGVSRWMALDNEAICFLMFSLAVVRVLTVPARDFTN